MLGNRAARVERQAGRQTDRQGLDDRQVVGQAGVRRQVGRVTDGELGKRGEGYQENGNPELGLENAGSKK